MSHYDSKRFAIGATAEDSSVSRSSASEQKQQQQKSSANGENARVLHDSSDECIYPSKRCTNPRAVKLNGTRHKFCELHRSQANLNQRRWQQRRRQLEREDAAELAGVNGKPLPGGRARRSVLPPDVEEYLASIDPRSRLNRRAVAHHRYEDDDMEQVATARLYRTSAPLRRNFMDPTRRDEAVRYLREMRYDAPPRHFVEDEYAEHRYSPAQATPHSPYQHAELRDSPRRYEQTSPSQHMPRHYEQHSPTHHSSRGYTQRSPSQHSPSRASPKMLPAFNELVRHVAPHSRHIPSQPRGAAPLFRPSFPYSSLLHPHAPASELRPHHFDRYGADLASAST